MVSHIDPSFIRNGLNDGELRYMVKRDVGVFVKTFKDSLMVLTVDDMLLLYDFDVQKDGKSSFGPNKKFNLQFLKIKERSDVGQIDLIEDQPGIFNSSQKELIKFEQNDDFEEFKIFILRYIKQ
ncbi:hypothetical protein IMG5_164940 [Ichthyophthirius multifiliis]|uniref:PH domain-containing protein n=1 Tax=Ichthyophthirius multifiliis TaxID=5932 RepID=G0R0H4_ICHMU|nr:hypothetical protein IMG5_164940 [Ichthyophthirius multifiliis]EGR29025.1 hypothetical protein IMG5_164940 [Ichthyophthirius multifiliis]|eukprot:XP_004030261.1 hypothetical protein IMG5_164940 [Ichthyophthirius multifiliis]